MNLARRLAAACGRYRTRLAIVDGDDAPLPYAAVDHAADEIARAHREGGLAAHEPVLLAVSNRARDLAGAFGIWLAGGVAVPVHRGAAAGTAEALLARAAVRFAVNARPELALPIPLGAGGPVLRLDRPPPPRRPLLEGAALVVFTSGSTGEPKGVVLGHAEFVAKLRMIQSMLRFAAGDRTLLVLQLTFSFGLWVSLLTLITGGTLVAHPRFEAERTLDALTGEAITRVPVVPTMLRMLLPLAEARTAPPFAGVVMSGGEPLPAALGRRLRALWPEAHLWDIYGLTETGTCDFFVPADDYDSAAGSIGRPAPGIAYRIASPDGELQIRTPTAMRGYLDTTEQTATAFDDGWFRTGDLARVREDGRVELVGRAKDVIVRAGNKVAPLEIERAFLEHPLVHAALVAGAPDPLRGEAIHLCVVPRPGEVLDEESLRAWAAGRLERYKLPDRIHVADALPMGSTGKADRSAFRRMLGVGELG